MDWFYKLLCKIGIHNWESDKIITSKYGDFIPSQGYQTCKRCKIKSYYCIDRS